MNVKIHWKKSRNRGLFDCMSRLILKDHVPTRVFRESPRHFHTVFVHPTHSHLLTPRRTEAGAREPLSFRNPHIRWTFWPQRHPSCGRFRPKYPFFSHEKFELCILTPPQSTRIFGSMQATHVIRWWLADQQKHEHKADNNLEVSEDQINPFCLMWPATDLEYVHSGQARKRVRKFETRFVYLLLLIWFLNRGSGSEEKRLRN